MTASAQFQISVNGAAYGAAGVAANAPPSATVACRLVSTVGVDPASIRWTNFGTHASTQAQLVPVLSGSPTGQIATFTLPATATGQAYGIECTVNGGASVTGIAGTTSRSAVYCLNPGGERPFFINELWESNATHGVIERLNNAMWAASPALVTQLANGSVLQTGGTAGTVLTSGAPTNGGAWSNVINIQAGGVTSPGNQPWNFGTGVLTHGAATWTADANAVELQNRGLWCNGVTGAVPTAGAGTRFFWAPARGATRCGAVTGTAWDDANVGDYSFATGFNTIASGNYSAALCNSTCSGHYSLSTGDSTASADFSLATGHVASATLQGQVAEAGASVTGAAGGSQRTRTSLIRSSTDAAAVELTIDGNAPGAGNVFSLASGKAYMIKIQVVCLCTAGTNIGQVATWFIRAGLKNIGGTSSVVGGITYDSTATDVGLAAATCVLTADDPNDRLALTCTGIVGGAANTFHWNATVYATEVK